MHICKEFEAIPTGKELDSFLGCNELLPEMLAKTHSQMESAKVMLDDRVKVLSGTFRGLLGKVVRMTADEADVHLPSQDLVERLRIWELAREFRVGDRVRTVELMSGKVHFLDSCTSQSSMFSPAARSSWWITRSKC